MRKVLPVIHCDGGTLGATMAIRNVRLAQEEGAHGIFLINHGMWPEDLLDLAANVVGREPALWVGVNCLGWDVDEVADNLPEGVKGVWSDKQAPKPEGFKGLYFGGVAFKYQGDVEDYAAAARDAMHLMDVITTSGPGTGRAASVEKVKTMKEAIGTMPLALASGVTPENVDGYLPYVDYYLVATGISKDFFNLDRSKLRRLIDRVHGDH